MAKNDLGLKKQCDIQEEDDTPSPLIVDYEEDEEDEEDKAWASIAEPVSLSELETVLEEI